jgi:hypothetical protein
MLGDTTKGGRRATTEELVRLAGAGPTGVPSGLFKCRDCGELKGECLDPNRVFKGMIMQVTCRCENDNRCARCGRPLDGHKLDANYFDPADGMIWHTPGFCALSHRCPDLS